MSAQPEIPLRPMTLGELLDAAMALLRRRALPLLVAALLLAGLEQLALAPLRSWGHMTPSWYGPTEADLFPWWITVAIGFGFELVVLTLLGALAGAAAGPALLGVSVRHRDLLARSRPVAAVGLALLLGLFGAVAALLLFVPWLVFFGFFAMTGAALSNDRTRRPLRRSAALAGRGVARGLWILVVAYLTWCAVRVALGAGWVELVSRATGYEPDGQTWLVPLARTLANAVAYAALACLTAVLVLEVRVRTEGLDILINRTRSRGGDPAAALVHTP
ncbi:hypothetical protein AB0M20_02675 [Actinoplanes sp. NPDC051633]|uniref:hypothetical protein n=1 Tax=Actinoplanes sp. NPDC051633 TaxID=3155670 RepID=UPI0034368CE6